MKKREQYEIKVAAKPAARDVLSIQRGLYEFNCAHVAANDDRNLTIFLRDAKGKLAGGLLGETWRDWLHIKILWIAERFRIGGYGAKTRLSFRALGYFQLSSAAILRAPRLRSFWNAGKLSQKSPALFHAQNSSENFSRANQTSRFAIEKKPYII